MLSTDSASLFAYIQIQFLEKGEIEIPLMNEDSRDKQVRAGILRFEK